MWKMILSCDGICILFWNTPKSKNFNFGSFSVLITWFLNAPFSYFRNFWNVPFSGSEGKMGHFFDFGAFQNKIQMPSHDKNHLSHAFWGISYYLPYFCIRIRAVRSSPSGFFQQFPNPWTWTWLPFKSF